MREGTSPHGRPSPPPKSKTRAMTGPQRKCPNCPQEVPLPRLSSKGEARGRRAEGLLTLWPIPTPPSHSGKGSNSGVIQQ